MAIASRRYTRWTSRSGRLRALLLALVAFGSCGLMVGAYAAHFLRNLENSSVDLRFLVRGHEPAPSTIVVVTIDDKTFQDLNQQWPFPRALHARLLKAILAEHPAGIAYDVQFSESSLRGQSDDIALLSAISDSHGKVVFSTTETDGHGNFRFMGSTSGAKLLRQVGGYAGNANFPLDSGGVIRRMTTTIGGLPSLAVQAAKVARGGRLNVAALGATNWIDYRGPAGTFHHVSFSDALLRGHLRPDYFRGKIVVVGSSAPSLQDVHPTSTDSQMAGPEIQASAIDTVLRGTPLHSFPGAATIVAILLLGAVVPLISIRLGPVAATAVAIGIGAVFVIGEQIAFGAGEIGTFVYPLLALAISGTGSLTVQLLSEAVERIRVRDLFARFVPENVVDEVLASADGLRLGGVQRDGTVMFTDLRGFTSLAETLTPPRVIEILNHYLSEMGDAILDHGGTLVAYMGDGIMAVFGAPLVQADHADRALASAREMLQVRLPRFNDWLRAEALSDGFRMGIGLNSGHVMSGHVGSERRVEYAAVGDTTNTAARIEQLTKGTPHMLLLSDTTRAALTTVPPDLGYVQDTEIRGRVGRVGLWTLVDGAQEPAAV